MSFFNMNIMLSDSDRLFRLWIRKFKMWGIIKHKRHKAFEPTSKFIILNINIKLIVILIFISFVQFWIRRYHLQKYNVFQELSAPLMLPPCPIFVKQICIYSSVTKILQVKICGPTWLLKKNKIKNYIFINPL